MAGASPDHVRRLFGSKTSSVLPSCDLPPWLSGLAISGHGAVKAWLAIRQGVGSYPTPLACRVRFLHEIILGQGTRGSACVLVKL